MAASQAWQLYVGRFLLGVGAGLEMTISPVYIMETTKPNMRDICGSLPQVHYCCVIMTATFAIILYELKIKVALEKSALVHLNKIIIDFFV